MSELMYCPVCGSRDLESLTANDQWRCLQCGAVVSIRQKEINGARITWTVTDRQMTPARINVNYQLSKEGESMSEAKRTEPRLIAMLNDVWISLGNQIQRLEKILKSLIGDVPEFQATADSSSPYSSRFDAIYNLIEHLGKLIDLLDQHFGYSGQIVSELELAAKDLSVRLEDLKEQANREGSCGDDGEQK